MITFRSAMYHLARPLLPALLLVKSLICFAGLKGVPATYSVTRPGFFSTKSLSIEKRERGRIESCRHAY